MMTTRTISYENFDGENVTEDFFFNLTKSELTFMQVNNPEGMSRLLKKIIAEKDILKLFGQISEIVCMAYGERSIDQKTGKTKFVKSQTSADEFRVSEAHSELIMGLIAKPEDCVDFIKSILPAGLPNAPADQANVPELPTITQQS